MKKLEYIWLDGYQPEPSLRSKVKVTDGSPPDWSFDGSSTQQAEGGSSDCILKPVNEYREGNSDTNDCNDDSGSAVGNLNAADDLDLDNATGEISAFSTSGSCLRTTWTATFTPTDNSEVLSNTITLKEDWTDQVGNPGFDNVTSVFEVETWRPRPTITITHPDNVSTGTGSTTSCCSRYSSAAVESVLIWAYSAKLFWSSSKRQRLYYLSLIHI